MRAVVSVCFGLSVLAISAAAFAQEGGVIPAAPAPAPAEPVVAPAPVVPAPVAPVVPAPAEPVAPAPVGEEAPAPKKAPARHTVSFFVGGELEHLAYRTGGYLSEWTPTSLGARVGFFLPTDRRAFERRIPEIAVIGSIGLRTAIASRSPDYYYGSEGGPTENFTIPIEIGVRSTPAPGPVAAYLEGGVRILMRHVTRTRTDYDFGSYSTTKTTSWDDGYVGLAVGGGVRINRFEIGLHATALSNDGETGELGIGLRGGYHFSQL